MYARRIWFIVTAIVLALALYAVPFGQSLDRTAGHIIIPMDDCTGPGRALTVQNGLLGCNTIEGGGGGVWGAITGTLSNQTDLQSALNAKAASSHAHTDADIPNTITIDLAAAATALASNPADCSANQFATAIAANGALTCAALTDADVPNTITVNTAAAATALAANPTDCTGGQFANAIDASGNLTCATPSGGGTAYALTVGALSSNPVDAATVFIGQHYATPATSASARRTYIQASGTITRASIQTFSGTAGTGEAWSAYIRLNNTTDTLIQTLSVTTSERVFTNTSLSIAVVAGDFFEIKMVNPTWVTNPASTVIGGYVYIQ